MEGATLVSVVIGILIGAVLLGGTIAMAKGVCSVKSGCCSSAEKGPSQKI